MIYTKKPIVLINFKVMDPKQPPEIWGSMQRKLVKDAANKKKGYYAIKRLFRDIWLQGESIISAITYWNDPEQTGSDVMVAAVNPHKLWRRHILASMKKSFIKKKRKRFAIVSNVGIDDEGSHWVVFLVDAERGLCDYFDSYGKPPRKFMKSMHTFVAKSSSKILNKPILLRHSNTQHQKAQGQCGVYVIWYALERFKGTRNLGSQTIGDESMCNMRRLYFKEPKVQSALEWLDQFR